MITLRFTEKSSNRTFQISLEKQRFIDACAKKKTDFFPAMFRFEGRDVSNLEIEVPSVIGIESLVNFIMDDPFARARRIVDKIYCADYIGVDNKYIKSKIRKLLKLDIDTETFGRVHHLIDSKGYDKLHIKFMARKLPEDYDISEFPLELLKRMQKVDKQNFILLFPNNRVIVYDFKKNNVVSELGGNGFFTGPSTLYSANGTYPIIATLSSGVLILYHLFEGTNLMELRPKSDSDCIKIMCFSTDGNLLYVARNNSIEIYDVHKLELIRIWSTGLFTPGQIICSPNNLYLAFTSVTVHENNYFYRKLVSILNLTNGIIDNICSGEVTNMWFLDGHTLSFVDVLKDDDVVTLFDCDHLDQKITADVKITTSDLFTIPKHILRPINDAKIQHKFKHKVCNIHQRTFVSTSTKSGKYNGFKIGGNKSSCVSYSGKYIYAAGDPYSPHDLKRYRFCPDGKLIYNNNYTIDIFKQYSLYSYSIANVCYFDRKLAEKINSISKK